MEFGPVAPIRGPAGPDAKAATAAVLRGFEAAHPDIAVLHSVPVPGASPDAVVDHVVVVGKHVWLVYSVAWPAGTYWAVQGPYRDWYFRGLRPLRRLVGPEPAWAARALRRHFRGVARVETPLVVAWPSHEGGALRLALWRPDWVLALTGRQLARRIGHIIEPVPASVAITGELMRLQLDAPRP